MAFEWLLPHPTRRCMLLRCFSFSRIDRKWMRLHNRITSQMPVFIWLIHPFQALNSTLPRTLIIFLYKQTLTQLSFPFCRYRRIVHFFIVTGSKLSQCRCNERGTGKKRSSNEYSAMRKCYSLYTVFWNRCPEYCIQPISRNGKRSFVYLSTNNTQKYYRGFKLKITMRWWDDSEQRYSVSFAPIHLFHLCPSFVAFPVPSNRLYNNLFSGLQGIFFPTSATEYLALIRLHIYSVAFINFIFHQLFFCPPPPYHPSFNVHLPKYSTW